jgi:preprotein translocase subunit SecE
VTDLLLVLLGGAAVALAIWLIDRGIRAAERDLDGY